MSRFRLRRGRQRRDYPAGPLQELAARPPADASTPVAETDFLAVDLETTGLDPRRDHVLAVGWVPLSRGQVELGGAREVVVRPPRGVPVGDSATIHGLTDDTVAAAIELLDVLPELLAALHGRVLVAHHAPIELDFLGRASRAAYGAPAPLTAVDTLQLQQRLLAGPNGEIPPGLLRLDGARARFGLPRYRAHRALTDAIATGELLLAQVAELEHVLGRPALLRDVGVLVGRR